MARWRVDLIRKRAEHLGAIEAANEKEAIKAAIEIYEIEPACRNRITVTKISDKDDNEGRLAVDVGACLISRPAAMAGRSTIALLT